MTGRKGRRGGGGGALRGFVVFVLGAAAGIAAWVLVPRLTAPGDRERPERPRVVEVTPGPTPPGTRPHPTPAAPRPGRKAPPGDFEAAGGPGGGSLAVVIDDVGHSDEALARLSRLEGPLALAVLPEAPRARQAVELARAKGWDLLVHLPMTPVWGGGEPGAIGPDDDDATIVRRVEAALALVPGAVGVNNHQGSGATADRRVMRAVLGVIRRRGLFFLDSRTSASTVGEAEARRLGVAVLARDVFLDAVRAETPGGAVPPGALAAAWEKALETARAKGQCVLIGHPHADTVGFLAGRLAGLARNGILRVEVSRLVE